MLPRSSKYYYIHVFRNSQALVSDFGNFVISHKVSPRRLAGGGGDYRYNMKVVLLIAAILSFNFILNVCRLALTLQYYQKFIGKSQKLSEYVQSVDRLFDKAGTNQIFVSTRFAGKSISFCLGMNNYRKELDEIFRQTIGVYKFRIRNTFNPIYWVELPFRITARWKWSLLWARKMFSAVFWLAGVIAAYLINRFLDILFPGFLIILDNILK